MKAMAFPEPASPYGLSEEEIERLDQIRFVDFMNRLLRAEGHRAQILPTNVQTTLRINDPDAGIDARVRDAPDTSRWIPKGLSVWQYKAGDIAPVEIYRNDPEKPGEFYKASVQEAVQQGGSYCFVVGVDITPTKVKHREKALDRCFNAAGLDPKGSLYTAAHIAEWASEHPSLVLRLRPILADFSRWEQWSQERLFQTPFYSDSQRQEILRGVREQLSGVGDRVHVRIEGPAGVGKTRLALEICRLEGLNERTLYAADPGLVPPRLFNWLSSQPSTTAIIVVDECDRIQADGLARQATHCNGRVRVLTVGPAPDATIAPIGEPGINVLETLNDESMHQLLGRVFPTQPMEIRGFCVQFSSGYVKLAVALSTAIERDPTIASIQNLPHINEIRPVLDRFVVTDPVDRRVMRGIALLNRVGWEGQVAAEGQTIMRFMGVEWPDARDRAGDLLRRGLISRRGRYLYVTPHLLAVWLASQVWQDRGRETLNVVSELPDWGGRRAFLERLGNLGDDATAQEVCESLLEPEGLYQTLDDINDSLRAELLTILGDARPEAGLRALGRIIGHLPRDQLLQLRQGRRQVIWTLENLARLPETFSGAARLLLQLAEAENEDIVNNATGVWASLFGTRLSGTAVPAIDRHVLIREALQSPPLGRKLLAVKAIESAIQVVEMGMPISSSASRLPVPHWQPSTKEEDQAARLSALTILDEAMRDTEPAVQGAAREVLLNVIRALVRTGLAGAALDRWDQIPIETDVEERRARDLVESILQYDEPYLNEDQKRQFTDLRDELLGESFHHRLRRWVGEWTSADGPVPRARREEFDRPDPQEMAASLAEEVLETPDQLWPELDWLASDAAKNVFFFGRRLGELDQSHIFWAEIEARVRQGNGQLLASAYIRGQFDAGRQDWRNRVLDSWSDQPEKAGPLLDAIWRGEADDRDASRLITVIRKGWLDAAELNLLIYGGQTKHFSREIFAKLLETVIGAKSESAMRAALSLLPQRLDFEPGDRDRLESAAWSVLEAGIPAKSDTMGEHTWARLASWYVDRDPTRITEIFLDRFETDDAPLIKNDQLAEILQKVSVRAPEAVWKKVASRLVTGKNYRLHIYLRGWFAGLFPPEIPLSWAKEQVPERPRIVAVLTPVEQEPLSELVRQLLIRYGDDDRVSSSLYSSYLAGPSGVASWWGDESAWLQPKMETARSWLIDPEQNVRRWASDVVQGLETRIRRAKRLEEEELF